jgi:hypothetical protein
LALMQRNKPRPRVACSAAGAGSNRRGTPDSFRKPAVWPARYRKARPWPKPAVARGWRLGTTRRYHNPPERLDAAWRRSSKGRHTKTTSSADPRSIRRRSGARGGGIQLDRAGTYASAVQVRQTVSDGHRAMATSGTHWAGAHHNRYQSSQLTGRRPTERRRGSGRPTVRGDGASDPLSPDPETP